MSDSKFMQEFRRGMEHCKVNPMRECAVRSPEPTWEENNGVVKFIQPEKSPSLRLVLLMLAENSYVVMLCDKDWTPVGQAPCSSVQEFSNKRAANLAFEAAARLCSEAGRIVIEQYRMQVKLSRPDELVTGRFASYARGKKHTEKEECSMKIPTSGIANHDCKQIRRWWQDREETTDATKKVVLWQLIRNRLEVNWGMDLLNRHRGADAVTIDFAERIVRWIKQREHVELVLNRVLWGDGDGATEMYITSPAEA